MKRGLHRKRIPVLGRGPKTRGTGFKYLGATPPPTVRELTAKAVAAKEAERQQQAILEEGRRLRQWNVNTLVSVAQKILRTWKEDADRNDQRLREFSGWTISDFCALPADEEVAELYEDEFYDYAHHHWGRSLSLADRDAIVKYHFIDPGDISTTQMVAEATTIIRHVAEKCCDNEGIEVERLIQMLGRRKTRARRGVDLALVCVRKKMASLFQTLSEGA